MYVAICDVNGRVKCSDSMSYEEMLDDCDGDDVVLKHRFNEMNSMFMNVGDKSLTRITLTIDGVARHYNPANIVWIEIREVDPRLTDDD